MLHLLLCRCHNSEPIARKLLHEGGCDDWQSHPVVKGKEQCLNYLDTLPYGQFNKEVDKLKGYIKRSSSWSVILGQRGSEFQWSDAGHGDLVSKLDAEVIVKEYKDGK